MASSQASRALSTASFKVVKTALMGEEKPTCCKFLEKYSAVLLLVMVLDFGAGAFSVIFFAGVTFEAAAIFFGMNNPFQRESKFLE